MALSSLPPIAVSGITIEWVRIRNFRSLKAVSAPLGSITVLIGENNAGKSSFVDALHASVGSGTRSLNEEDIYLTSGESAAPKDRDITIDLLIRRNHSRAGAVIFAKLVFAHRAISTTQVA